MRQSTSPKGARGIGIVRTILLIPLLLIVALIVWVIFAEARKSYWDGKVREMCAKDGGVQVFETLPLDQAAYESLRDKFGNIVIRPINYSSKTAPIIMETKDAVLREGNPEVRRTEYYAIRLTDRKVLGRSVFYSRVGGDSFALHPSSFGCPKDSKSLSEVVISKKGSLYGEVGADFIDGGSSDDFLFGDADVTLVADQGNDQLVGGNGNDQLVGKGGDDAVDGGTGSDENNMIILNSHRTDCYRSACRFLAANAEWRKAA